MTPSLENGGRGKVGTATFRLSLMMFLQYAVWGAWLPVAARYLEAPPSEGGLGFSSAQIGMILGLAGSIGAICAPLKRISVRTSRDSAAGTTSLRAVLSFIRRTPLPTWAVSVLEMHTEGTPPFCIPPSTTFGYISHHRSR
ncbi:MAG: hypothetical protein IID37_15805 [Planctomycetes bacterium]|nr:hypothetical protein [Planctomycetota bacterium]